MLVHGSKVVSLLYVPWHEVCIAGPVHDQHQQQSPAGLTFFLCLMLLACSTSWPQLFNFVSQHLCKEMVVHQP